MKGTKLHYGYVIVACCCLIMGVNVGLTFSCAGIFFQPVSEAARGGVWPERRR